MIILNKLIDHNSCFDDQEERSVEIFTYFHFLMLLIMLSRTSCFDDQEEKSVEIFTYYHFLFNQLDDTSVDFEDKSVQLFTYSSLLVVDVWPFYCCLSSIGTPNKVHYTPYISK